MTRVVQSSPACTLPSWGALGALFSKAVPSSFGQQERISQLSGCERFEQCRAFVVENDMAALAALAGPDVNRAAIGVEIRSPKRSQFAIACARYQRSLCQTAEIRIARIQEPLCFGDVR